MSITWNNVSGVGDQVKFKDFVYKVLKTLEANPTNWLYPVPMSGKSGITIGIGFDMKNAPLAARKAVLKVMGLQADLLDKDPATLSASETIEVAYVNRLLTQLQFKSVAAVNKIMEDRATCEGILGSGLKN